MRIRIVMPITSWPIASASVLHQLVDILSRVCSIQRTYPVKRLKRVFPQQPPTVTQQLLVEFSVEVANRYRFSLLAFSLFPTGRFALCSVPSCLAVFPLLAS